MTNRHLPRIPAIVVGPYLGREIVGHYLLGSDIIHIEAKERIDLEVRKIVKATVGSLIGLEIVEESHSQIVLQCLLEPSGFPPEKILRRNYAIVAGMLRDSVNSFIDADVQLAKSVMARDDENNRLVLFACTYLAHDYSDATSRRKTWFNYNRMPRLPLGSQPCRVYGRRMCTNRR